MSNSLLFEAVCRYRHHNFTNRHIPYFLMKLHSFILSLMFLSSLFGCSSSQKFDTLAPQLFVAYIAADDVVRLDVRTAEEFAAGHLAGAKNVDVLQPQFLQRAEALLQGKKKVALYCRSGRRSQEAAKQLSEAGYEVKELGGGFMAWEAAALPTQR